MDAYSATLARLYGRTNEGIKLGLETTRELLRALGHPDAAMQHVVVAGTNGKGSTSTLMATALRDAGHRVGHFTSPHLLRFTERITIDGQELSRAAVVDLAARIEAASVACTRPPTFFEIVTAMALVAFAEAKVTLAVLEVGMGGRLDATNAVAKRQSVITAIDLDHQRYLGDTLAAIAAEKAGIIEARVPVVTGRQHDEALAVLERAAALCHAPLVRAPELSFASGVAVLPANDTRAELRFAAIPQGSYQRDNLALAATALSLLDATGLACPPAAIILAARDFVWPGRYQWLRGGASARTDVLVDGAHNPAGITALLAALADDVRVGPTRALHVVTTVLADRPAEQMLKPVARRATTLQLVPVRSPRSRSAPELATLAASYDAQGTAAASCAEALAKAIERAHADGGLVLVCGSLLLVADALAELTGAPRDPPADG